MAGEEYILALDQGTTSSRAVVIDASRNVISVAQKAFRQIFQQPGWVEHYPREIWSSQSGFYPAMDAAERSRVHSIWHRALQRAMDWELPG